jgi:16S rRNA (cytosine967-C5)-methyltransferase
MDINENKAYSNIALNKYFSASELRDIDKAFITEIVYGTVKWKLFLDRVIASYSNIKMEKLSPWILNILRLGAYQMLKMSKVPQSAACNESVKLAGKYGHKASQGYVNAVLRNIARGGADAAIPERSKDLTGYLSVMYSYPKWLTQMYIDLFGAEAAESLLDAGNKNPESTVRTNTLRISRDKLIELLNEAGVEAVRGRYAEEAVTIKSHVSFPGLKAFREGLFQVQDESSMLPARVLAPKPGDTVLDACSAPGGKTTHIAQLMGNKGTIIARDVHEHKLRLVSEAARRLGIDIIKTELTDAAVEAPKDAGVFDRVLLDAPCTGLGIIRRKPDIKWARETKEMKSISQLQRLLIRNVSKAVKPGGIIVYSTCTMLPSENEDVVNEFVNENHEFELDDIKTYLPDALAKHSHNGMLQLYPDRDGIDGFFIARIRRKENML